jgi:chromosome segregation ATPase
MEQALGQLGSTISTINAKVETIRQKSSNYKKNIGSKLQQVLSQLQALRNNPKIANIQQTQQMLAQTQAELTKKTQELEQSNTKLTEVSNNLQMCQNQLQTVSKELEQRRQELANAQNAQSQNQEKIKTLEEQITQLTSEKTDLEDEFKSIQLEQNDLINKIAQINSLLVQQISTIDSLANELPDNDFSQEFKSIGDNIQAVVNLLNSSNPGPSNNTNGQGTGKKQVLYSNVSQRGIYGGKRRNKTKKHISKRRITNKKYKNYKKTIKGGYTYGKEDNSLRKSSYLVSSSSKHL